MSLSFNATEVRVNNAQRYGDSVRVEVEVADDQDVLEEVSIKDAILHYGEDELLEEIGKEKVMDYYQLVEEGEE